MVRKRAHAEKALTPPKDMPNRKSSRRNSKSSCIVNETPSKKVKEENTNTDEKNTTEGFEEVSENNGATQEEINEVLLGTESEIEAAIEDPTLINLSKSLKELPDYSIFSKDLSDKAKSFWDVVKNDYHDFSNWTSLLQSVTEDEENIEAARGAYNCFLRYYPLCYGYWKKFADIERKRGNIEEAKKVFERGVAAIPISIDLWVHYLNFSMQQNKGRDNQKLIRDLFSRAIDAAGLEFKSNKLWDAYIEWERSLGNLKNVTEIFDRLIATPTQQYLKSWQKLKSHLEKHSPIDIIPPREYGRLVKEIDSLPPGMTVDEDLLTQTSAKGDDENNDASGNYIINNDAADDETMKETYQKMRNKVLKERNSLFLETGNEIRKRWQYEEAIKRPYFHVKPLEKSQIKNWKDYLDYEIQQGNHERIVFLFERCIVVCALYESFWVKYLDYVEEKDPAVARTVFLRACDIHLMKKYKLHLRWATFEEREKNYDKAAVILSQIDCNFPGMVMITQKRVGLARRMNKLDDAVSVYEAAIQNSELIEDKIFYSIKLSHVLAKFCSSKSHARNVLWNALQLGKKHKRLYLQLLDLETHYGSVESDFVNKLFHTVENDMCVDNEFKECFAQRKLEFYEEYGDNVDEIEAVQNNYKDRKQYYSDAVVERPPKETSSKRKQSFDGSNRLDINKVTMPVNNVPMQQQQRHQQQNHQWNPPPPEGRNYYGWYGQYGSYNQDQ